MAWPQAHGLTVNRGMHHECRTQVHHDCTMKHWRLILVIGGCYFVMGVEAPGNSFFCSAIRSPLSSPYTTAMPRRGPTMRDGRRPECGVRE